MYLYQWRANNGDEEPKVWQQHLVITVLGIARWVWDLEWGWDWGWGWGWS